MRRHLVRRQRMRTGRLRFDERDVDRLQDDYLVIDDGRRDDEFDGWRQVRRRAARGADPELRPRAAREHGRPGAGLRGSDQPAPLRVSVPASARAVDGRRDVHRQPGGGRSSVRSGSLPLPRLRGERAEHVPRLAVGGPGRRRVPPVDVGRGPGRLQPGPRPLHQHDEPGLQQGRVRVLDRAERRLEQPELRALTARGARDRGDRNQSSGGGGGGSSSAISLFTMLLKIECATYE